MPSDKQHTPVLVREIMEQLAPQDGDTLLDGTLGLGGHAKAFLEAAGQDAKVIGFDADASALAEAKHRLKSYGERVRYIHANFSNLKEALEEAELGDVAVSHVLLDLGVGSHQLGDETRGFTFRGEGPLSMMYADHVSLPGSDMASLNVLAQRLGYYPDVIDMIRGLGVNELAAIIRNYGEERFARRIADSLKHSVEMVKTAKDLARVIAESVPPNYERGRIHPATRTFQALRIAVNRELEVLRAALPAAVDKLETGGNIAVISFHSLEDRIVKQYFRREAKDCICPPEQLICTCQHTAKLEILTKKPIVAAAREIEQNPRSRSAKLRVAKKK